MPLPIKQTLPSQRGLPLPFAISVLHTPLGELLPFSASHTVPYPSLSTTYAHLDLTAPPHPRMAGGPLPLPISSPHGIHTSSCLRVPPDYSQDPQAPCHSHLLIPIFPFFRAYSAPISSVMLSLDTQYLPSLSV